MVPLGVVDPTANAGIELFCLNGILSSMSEVKFPCAWCECGELRPEDFVEVLIAFTVSSKCNRRVRAKRGFE